MGAMEQWEEQGEEQWEEQWEEQGARRSGAQVGRRSSLIYNIYRYSINLACRKGVFVERKVHPMDIFLIFALPHPKLLGSAPTALSANYASCDEQRMNPN